MEEEHSNGKERACPRPGRGRAEMWKKMKQRRKQSLFLPLFLRQVKAQA
ncbi:MAG: hypothetical protein HFH94_12975 [Lachnospiraceae bacterium]|nr:hypothetical protein [uncultured Acetatifactor sp.]MCI9220631.1 hypothetical protein [Lachnospiraceae bacterium]